MKRTVKFDYAKLRPMDMVLCGGRGPVSALIRARTAGRKQMFNKQIATHCGLVVDWHWQILIVEMLVKAGLSVGSMEHYTTLSWPSRRFVLGVRRSHVYDNLDIQEKAQARIAVLLRKRLEYDKRGVGEFLCKNMDDDPWKNYCSEFVYEQMRADGVTFPSAFAKKVSPRDLQVVAGFQVVSCLKSAQP